MRVFGRVAFVLTILAAGLAVRVQPASADHVPPPTCESHGGRFEPPLGKVLHIIGQDNDSTDAYVAGTGIVPAGVMFYMQLAAPVAAVTAVGGTQDPERYMRDYPHAVLQIGLGLGKAEAAGSGALDANIIALGEKLREMDRPVLLRIGYEFENYEKASYIATFRRIVSMLRQRGVNNVAAVWHSKGQPDFADWYPGDGYVDWVGVSVYGNAHTGAMNGKENIAAFAETHDKPMMIAESTPMDTRLDEETPSSWYTNVFNYIDDWCVDAFSYINADWDSQPLWKVWGTRPLEEGYTPGNSRFGDSRIEINSTIRSMWLNEIGQSKYLKSSPTLWSSELGYNASATPVYEDDLMTTNGMFAHSTLLKIENTGGSCCGDDEYRLTRRAKTREWAIWRVPGLTTARAVTYYHPSEPYNAFRFSFSADGVTFTPVTPVVTNGTGSTWTKKIFEVAAPAGSVYLKVEFPNVTNTTDNARFVQLGHLTLTGS